MRPRDLAADAMFLAIAGVSALDGAGSSSGLEFAFLVALVAVVAITAAVDDLPFHAPLAAIYVLYGVYWLAAGLHRWWLGGFLVLFLATYHGLSAAFDDVGVAAGG